MLAAAPLLSGCATTGATRPAPDTPAVAHADTPLLERILQDLAANDAAIQSFRASGKFVLKSPELEDVQILRQSAIRFQRPASLHVVGRKYSKAVFELTCSDEGFLIVLPTESKYFDGGGGARLRGVSGQVSPRDIAIEMFFPEDWSRLKQETVLLSGLDEAGGRAELQIYENRRRDGLRRRVTVEGPPWRLVENQRFDGGAEPVAVTTLSAYKEQGGARFATLIESSFPGENAFMQFDASTFELNASLPPDEFDVEAQRKEVRRKGYQQLERH